MKRNVALALLILAVFANGAPAQSLDPFSYTYENGRLQFSLADGKCFLCGRTPTDYVVILDTVRDLYTSVQFQLYRDKNAAIDSIRRDFKDFLDYSTKSGHPDFTFRTIKTDLKTFTVMIPQIEKVLEFASSEGFNDQTKVSQIAIVINNCDTKEMARLTQRAATVNKAFLDLDNAYGDMKQFKKRNYSLATLLDFEARISSDGGSVVATETPSARQATKAGWLWVASGQTEKKAQKSFKIEPNSELPSPDRFDVEVSICPICEKLLDVEKFGSKF